MPRATRAARADSVAIRKSLAARSGSPEAKHIPLSCSQNPSFSSRSNDLELPLFFEEKTPLAISSDDRISRAPLRH